MTDLTPSTYLNRCRARAAQRWWVIAALLCVLLAAVPIGIQTSQPPDRSLSVAREGIAQAQARLVQNKAASEKNAAALTQHERELQAESHLTRRPDWSDLLSRIAGQFQGKAVMTGFRLGALSDSKVRAALGPAAADASAGSVWLIVTGVADANSDVPGLILRLEQLGLFEQIVMTGTQRETFAGAARTGFTLACRVQ